MTRPTSLFESKVKKKNKRRGGKSLSASAHHRSPPKKLVDKTPTTAINNVSFATNIRSNKNDGSSSTTCHSDEATTSTSGARSATFHLMTVRDDDDGMGWMLTSNKRNDDELTDEEDDINEIQSSASAVVSSSSHFTEEVATFDGQFDSPSQNSQIPQEKNSSQEDEGQEDYDSVTIQDDVARTGELALLHDSIIVRYDLKIPLVRPYAFRPTKVLSNRPVDYLRLWFNTMQQLDPTFALLPWYSSSGDHPIVDGNEIRSYNCCLFRYFRRLRRLDNLARKDYLHVDVRVAHSIPIKDLLSLASPWLKARQMGMWPKQLQADKIVCIGWFLFSTREMDIDKFAKDLSEEIGLQVALRYRIIETKFHHRSLVNGLWRRGDCDDGTKTRAIHVDVKLSDEWSAKQELSEIYDVDTQRGEEAASRHEQYSSFPYIRTVLFVQSRRHSRLRFAPTQRGFLDSLHTHRIQGIVGRKLHEPCPVFECSIRDWLLEMEPVRARDWPKLFVSVDLAFRSDDELVIAYHKINRFEAEAVLQAVEPFVRFWLSERSYSIPDELNAGLEPFVETLELWSAVAGEAWEAMRRRPGISDDQTEGGSTSGSGQGGDSDAQSDDEDDSSTGCDGNESSVQPSRSTTSYPQTDDPKSGSGSDPSAQERPSIPTVNARAATRDDVVSMTTDRVPPPLEDWIEDFVREGSDFDKVVGYTTENLFDILDSHLCIVKICAVREEAIMELRLAQQHDDDGDGSTATSAQADDDVQPNLLALEQDVRRYRKKEMELCLPAVLAYFQHLTTFTDNLETVRQGEADLSTRSEILFEMITQTYAKVMASLGECTARIEQPPPPLSDSENPGGVTD